jgi:hypothetical protein
VRKNVAWIFVETNRFKPTDPQSNITARSGSRFASADTGILAKSRQLRHTGDLPTRISAQESGRHAA